MKRFSTILFSIIMISCLAMSFQLVLAAGESSEGAVDKTYGLDKANEVANLPQTTDIPTVIGKVLGTVLGFTGTIFFVLVVYAGLMWMTAAGNDDRIKKARQILVSALIGLVIVLSAYAITRYIGSAIG